METVFTAEFFRGNRQRLRNLFTGTAPIILTANGLLQKSADETYRFKQESNFWYLTGIDEPNVVLVMDKDKEYLIVPKLSHAKEMFDGAIDFEKLSKASGISEILLEKEGWKRLSTRLKRVSNVATLAPSPKYVDYLGMYTNPARHRLASEIKKINKEVVFLDLRQHLQRMRMIKQALEIDALKRAIEITIGALHVVEQKYRDGTYANEFEVELDLTKYFWQHGSAGHGFDPIVASGAKAAQVHSMSNNSPFTQKDSLLLDIGAEYNHYVADISRSWAVKPSKRHQQLFKAVGEASDYAMSLLKPGITIREYEQTMETFMGEKLRELGLITTIDHDAVRYYFPHATSHFLGIDVHDFGDYERPLAAGAVLTVEPGIYIPEEGIGLRIEDDILITKDGCINLSAKLPRQMVQ